MISKRASAVCCTFGRPHLLEESIQCFLDQDYADKELIIVNDASNPLSLQKANAAITIVNCATRFESLGSKRNFATSLAKGEFVFVWDDDDLYLPWRMSSAIKFLEAHPVADGVKASRALVSTNDRGYEIESHGFHSQVCLRSEVFQRHQYPVGISCGEDYRLEVLINVALIDVDPLYWAVCRWGLGIYHISGLGEGDQEGNWLAAARHVEAQPDPRSVVKPRFRLPHWQNVDEKMVRSVDRTSYNSWREAIDPYL